MSALVLASALSAAGRAHADTLFLEAEGNGDYGHPFSSKGAKITWPMLIVDDPAASMGRYLTVVAGNNSTSAPPAAEGVATYPLKITTAGTYRIWARVIAPTTSDDSFWVKVKDLTKNTTTQVKWILETGTAWHWALVGTSTTSPSSFALSASTNGLPNYQIEVSYNEDGAKLDQIVITNDTSFNPKSPPKTAPALPTDIYDAPNAIPRKLTAGATGGIRVFWSEVPGAKSYTLKRWSNDGAVTLPTITGLTTHMYQETSLPAGTSYNKYDVTAIFSDGSSRTWPFDNLISQNLSFNLTFVDAASALSPSSPMLADDKNNCAMCNDSSVAYTAAGTAASLNSAPAHGRLRFDFVAGGAAKLQMWFTVNAPDAAHDSFWARVDDGTWVKWNNIFETAPAGTQQATSWCKPVSNADASNARVTFSVAAGTHRFELAYRETGAVGGVQVPSLANTLHITDDLNATSSICSN